MNKRAKRLITIEPDSLEAFTINIDQTDWVPPLPLKSGIEDPVEVRSYLLTLEPNGGNLNPKLVPDDPRLKAMQENSLQLNVPRHGCIFDIRLDVANWDLSFVPPRVRLAKVSDYGPSPKFRYYGLRPSPDNLHLFFNAYFNKEADEANEANTDRFNIYATLEGSLLTIDPDIRNPGDNV